MALCLISNLKRDHKLSSTGEWLLFLGMREDNKSWLLVNPNIGTETEVRSSGFHEDKWINTWRRERNENVDPTPKPFEKQVESTPPSWNFGEPLRSQLLTKNT